MKKSFLQRAEDGGLRHPPGSPYHGMDARQLRAANPEMADRAAQFIQENKAELVALIAGKIAALPTIPLTCRIVGSDAGSCAPVPIKTLNEASAKYRAFIEDNYFGASGAGSCYIYEGKKIVAHVSYNGKVWEGKTHKPGSTPLYEP